jgi:hypothetical protein
MATRARNGFKVWTTGPSVFVAVMLYPSIVGRHGVWKSLSITVFAVGLFG